jgi:hypothetical protein
MGPMGPMMRMLRGRLVVARIPRFVKKGMILATLALTLGGVMGFAAPAAHAASSCSAIDIGSAQIPNLNNAGMSGVAMVDVFGYYNSSGYCGYMTVQAFAHLNPGSSGGYLWGGLYDCSGHYITGTNVLYMSGGGSSGQYFHTIESSHGSRPCGFGAVEAWSYEQFGIKLYMQATTPTIWGTSLG